MAMLDSVCVCENFKVPSGKLWRVENAMAPETQRHLPPNTDTIQTKPFPVRGMFCRLLLHVNMYACKYYMYVSII